MRVQVKLADEMVGRIDNYCNNLGVSRSALCAIAIGQYVANLDKTNSLLDGIGGDLVEYLKKAVNDENE